MSKGIDILRKDHQLTTNTAWPIVFRVLVLLQQGQPVSKEAFDGLVEFLNDFFLEHHVPLESALIEAAYAHGMENGEMMEKITVEHEHVRNYVAALASAFEAVAAGDPEAVEKCNDCGAQFIDFFLRHEAEEDSRLFPLMEPVLTEADDEAALAAVEMPWEEEDAYSHFFALLKRIEAEILKKQ